MSQAIDTVAQKVSYGIGLQMGSQLRDNNIDGLEIDLVIEGLRTAIVREASRVPNEELQAAFEELNKQMQAKAEEAAKEAEAEGLKFLEENAKRDGVVVTESGLQYEVLVEGDGAKPDVTSNVRTHYHGTFIDGRVFDSSVERNQPAEFAVGGVISGWTEALQLMGVGSKWRLVIPSKLAYGAQGAGGSIPPHSTLVFEVELLDIL
ncbi:FKBP-type peptidyl-prolyl cis-trans isomerase [Motiliproteus sp.]|uniref:FKBP-type peptidyl-prolyl cis-trans isomerase n=1 Tax=Motiliproteus sp. TaxID=1898955 RepID=UPI003BACDD57